MMDGINLFIGIASLALSIYAVQKVMSASQAKNLVVDFQNKQVDRDRIKQLLPMLNQAKEAAIRRQSRSPRALSIGYKENLDLQCLEHAHDALKTSAPLNASEETSLSIQVAADEIGIALTNINNKNTKRDGWTDALSALQNIIPQLEREERAFGDTVLRKLDVN